MKRINIAISLIVILLTSCGTHSGKHLIADKAYRKLVHEQYLKQRELAHGRDSVLFSVFNNELTRAETEGLEFLYAFMPLSDLAMNDGTYYLAQVKSALEAKSFFSWGKDIPDEVFLHFVLPYRVNNEYTDTARQVFFAELKDRIKNMGMAEAALEVNHWCHEKVNYKSTDERTSGPLSTVRTAFGRCGEESTFTAAALRSVCIPARQVYTPRWAHTDDNHAWVEVWVDGKWQFMGACEPEPALDMGWFAEPVKRAMMTHTFVYGQYKGNEEILEKNELFTRLNLLKNYTDTKELPVKVLGTNGKPVEKARVEYSLYNYAEFYPIATLYTDVNGVCAASTGYGDLLIWASKDGQFSYKTAPGASSDTIVLTIKAMEYNLPSQILTLTPPAKQALPPADQSKADLNNRRLQQEDSIRNAYIATFIDSASAVKLASDKGLDAQALWSYLSRSRGNWQEIVSFVRDLSAEYSVKGMALLANISEKDLHDIQAETMNDHLKALAAFPSVSEEKSDEEYNRYVLAPRIGREFVTRWRSYIQQSFSASEASAFRNDPMKIREWISTNITLDTITNYYGVPLSPEGMLQLGRADRYSRDLLFVAIARSFGVPARLEAATRRPQFISDHKWKDVFFGNRIEKTIPRGELVLENATEDKSFIPRYYTHFTIARFDQGRFVTLDYEYEESLNAFPCRLSVDTGYYRLVTGNRMSDGSVHCSISYFRVSEGEPVYVGIRMATQQQQSGILGKADLQAGFLSLADRKPALLSSFTSDKGMIIALIDPGKEPTKHLMEDLKAVKKSLGEWGGQILLIVAKEKMNPGFSTAAYKGLPENAIFGHDANGEVSASVTTVCSISNVPQWPVVAVVNPKGEIIWHFEGYSIGLGDQLVKQIKGMDR
ncbi:MAG: transglutaminase domain-containing protein [Lentimicrobium sp.]